MAEIYHPEDAVQQIYWERRRYKTIGDQIIALKKSSTVYVGNIDPKTTEQKIIALFSRVGSVKNFIMGIDDRDEPCGFCFVVYHNLEDARMSVMVLHEAFLDGNIIKVELDPGWEPGREKGRGKEGRRVCVCFLQYRFFNYLN
jgi:nuclear cap-binding protein subunit 2